AQGAAYAFSRPAAGWSGTIFSSTKLTASDGAANDNFGWSIALDADRIAIGRFVPLTALGSAYVFDRPAGNWPAVMTETQKLTSPGGGLDFFGVSVALADHAIVAGAPGAVVGVIRAGAAYVFG